MRVKLGEDRIKVDNILQFSEAWWDIIGNAPQLQDSRVITIRGGKMKSMDRPIHED